MRSQSVSSAVAARAWQAAMAAWSQYGPSGRAERLAPLERGQAAPDQEVVPARAVLVEQQDRLAAGSEPRPQPRRLDLHERHQPVHLGLLRRQLGQDAAEPERLLAQRRPDPVLAGRGRVALVEDEVDRPRARTRAARAASAAAAPRTGRAPRRACAWPARCAARASCTGTRNARAISSVVRPPSRRSVSATRASGASTGWQVVKTSRSRSSPMKSSSAACTRPRGPAPRPRGAPSDPGGAGRASWSGGSGRAPGAWRSP